MPLLTRKSFLAVAVVTDVAVNSRDRLVRAKDLATRYQLLPRHFERVLQALVREGILKGVLGPRGGYEPAREQRRITVNDILRAVGTIDDDTEEPVFESPLVKKVVCPALAKAESAFSKSLSQINVEHLARSAASIAQGFNK
jgi:Rrf2 family protein